MANILQKLLTMGEGRQLRAYEGRVERVNELEPSIKSLSDTQLAAKTVEFRERLENGEDLEALLPEAFAVTREASVRALGMRHFDGGPTGPVAIRSALEEWPFCCSFHGPLGLHFLKAYLAATAPGKVLVNFPIAFQAPIEVGGRPCTARQ